MTDISHLLNKVHNADCLEFMKQMPDGCVDAIVTDPPYGLGFMGVKWDTYGDGKGRAPSGKTTLDQVGGNSHARKPGGVELIKMKENQRFQAKATEWAEAMLRVAKPGAHMLAFGGTRTHHRLMCAIEDAGWEIRDCLMWVYGSGFPKSLDVSKAIDKEAGITRPVLGYEDGASQDIRGNSSNGRGISGPANRDRERIFLPITSPATESAQQWEGWGTALKPAYEPIILARKPLEGTVAKNVQKYGTGAINVDGCRVGTDDNRDRIGGGTKGNGKCYGNSVAYDSLTNPQGRWPANLIHDGSDEVLAVFPDSAGQLADVPIDSRKTKDVYGKYDHNSGMKARNDSGSAARFFMKCSLDDNCSLCYSPYTKTYNKENEQWKSTLASSAEKSGWTTLEITEFIARVSALVKHKEQFAQNVKSAGNLCDSCATSIVAVLVGIKTSDFSDEELQVILDCMQKSGNSILIQNLVSFAELWGNIDTIPSMNSLCLLFGSVHHAIGNCIKLESRARAEDGKDQATGTRFRYEAKASPSERGNGNIHPTVKPLALMRYLCRLITPPRGIVLDPFGGSCTTGIAAYQEGFRWICIEREEKYVEMAEARIKRETQQLRMFTARHP